MKMKRYIIACLLAGSGALMTSCGDYLDIVPDNVISLPRRVKFRDRKQSGGCQGLRE